MAALYAFSNRIVYGGNAQELSGILVVETPATQWAYAVELPLCQDASGDERAAHLNLEVCVHDGRLGVGILSRDRREYRQEVHVSPADGQCCALEFIFGRFSSIGPLIIRNTSGTGPSRGTCRILGAA